MKKVNVKEMAEEVWDSPKGKFAGRFRCVSEALGRVPESTDLMERHPFDVEISRVPAGKTAWPYHSHSAQWEFYHVSSGRGYVRHEAGETEVVAGDAFLFKPGEPHTFRASESEDLVMIVIADNPIGETSYYPDSDKYMVRSPERKLVRSEALDYFDGEE